MIAWARIGGIVLYSPTEPFRDQTRPKTLLPVQFFNGTIFISETPSFTAIRYSRLRSGSMGVDGSLLELMLLTSFQLGTMEYAVFGSAYSNGGFIESSNGQRFPLESASRFMSAAVAVTDYGAVVGLYGYRDNSLTASFYGFDALTVRLITEFVVDPYASNALQNYIAAPLVFPLDRYAYIVATLQQSMKGFIVDTTSFQAAAIDSALSSLAAFSSSSLIAGSLRNAFACGVFKQINDSSYILAPRFFDGQTSAAICLVKPRADNLFNHYGVEFSLPIGVYHATPTPIGIFFTSRNSVIYCNPVSSVTTLISPQVLGVREFVSPLVYFSQGSFLLAGYDGRIGTNYMLSVFLGTFAVPFNISDEPNLLHPINGTTVSYPQFVFKPTPSSLPTEFEVIVTDKDRFVTHVFASYESRTFFEYSRDGTAWIRMTGPIIPDGTTIVRYTPPIAFPPGNYEWSVRRIAFGG